MSNQSGVACTCGACNDPQWYDHGVCQGCRSASDVRYTWVAKAESGGGPSQPPQDVLALQAGAAAQLLEVWTNLVLLRGLSPYLTSGQALVQYSSAPWYVQRGIDTTVQFTVPTDPSFGEKLNRASSWTNQSFVVRAVTVFEGFGDFGLWTSVQLPARPGMRELHFARLMRNKIAHGDVLCSDRLKAEALALFGLQAVVSDSCNLDISLVLEPLWARLLLYATALEPGQTVPPDPAVVVAVSESSFLAQTLSGLLQVPRSGKDVSIGDVVSAS